MQRAWSTLVIKAADNGKRRFSGIASTPSTDRMGDIVDPRGAKFKLPIPLLWQHDSKDPIGWIDSARVTEKGIEVEGEVASFDEEGDLKTRLNKAWQMLKAGLVRGLSIGFNAHKSEPIKGSFGVKFTSWEWLELSAVTIPANQDASIIAIKSIDTAMLSASGQKHGSSTPAVAGMAPKGNVSTITRTYKVKTIQELIEQRAEKAARMKELTDMFVSEQRHSTAEEGAEFDQLAEDVGSLDDDIRVAKMHQFTASTASAVQGNTQRAATQSRGRGPAIILNREPEDKFPGQSYTRGVIAKALAFLNQTSADRIAEARWGKSHPTLVNVIKADVAGGGSGSGEWGAELVSADNRFTGDFLEYLYSMTVFDRLPLKSIPANVAVKGQDGASTGYWVGESKSIPATTADFSSVSLTPLKVAALAVVSNELLRDSSPSAEMLVRDSLVEAAAQIADTTFLSTSAASAGVSPAGILNGVTIGTSAGATADDMREDIAGLINLFIAAKYRMTGLAFIMTPSLALQISLMRNALGQAEYPSITMNGGTLEGIPVYTGHNVGTGDFILASTADIWKIGDGGLQVSMSRDAMIEQSDAPTGATDTPAAASTKFTSMFQAESTAIKVVRSMNFQKRRSNAVAYIGNAAYGGATSI